MGELINDQDKTIDWGDQLLVMDKMWGKCQ
jgi:hypothetical protein